MVNSMNLNMLYITSQYHPVYYCKLVSWNARLSSVQSLGRVQLFATP